MRRLSRRSLLSAIGLCVSLLLLAFVLTNSNHHTKDTPGAPCDCPKAIKDDAQKSSAVAPPIAKQLPNTATLPPLPACKPVGLDSPVQRAILIYYPHHQFDYFFPEIRWYEHRCFFGRPRRVRAPSVHLGSTVRGRKCYVVSLRCGARTSSSSPTTSPPNFEVSAVSIASVRRKTNHPCVACFSTYPLNSVRRISRIITSVTHSTMPDE